MQPLAMTGQLSQEVEMEMFKRCLGFASASHRTGASRKGDRGLHGAGLAKG